jgi:hypothetical protein
LHADLILSRRRTGQQRRCNDAENDGFHDGAPSPRQVV